VTVAEGAIDGADLDVTSDYSQALPVARLIYRDDIKKHPSIPDYFIELHNRMAVITQ
jgi:hypothetical protein